MYNPGDTLYDSPNPRKKPIKTSAKRHRKSTPPSRNVSLDAQAPERTSPLASSSKAKIAKRVRPPVALSSTASILLAAVYTTSITAAAPSPSAATTPQPQEQLLTDVAVMEPPTLSAPIAKLPAEMLQEIFLFSSGTSEEELEKLEHEIFDFSLELPLDTSSLITSNPGDALHRPPWTISQVCRLWRSVTCSVSSLWNRIHIDADSSRDWVDLLVTRSGQANLHIFINYTTKSPAMFDLLTIILPTSGRWQTLAMRLPSDLLFEFEPIRNTLRTLRTLYLDIIAVGTPQATATLFENTNNIVNVFVEIRGEGLSPVHLEVSRTRRFHLPLSAVAASKSHCFTNRIPHVWLAVDCSLGVQQVRCSNLRELSLTRAAQGEHVISLLSSITAPNLDSVRVFCLPKMWNLPFQAC
ncbi:hypothetical protein D9758_011175 [Tetrapyrgos nigripes]|uniref:F-box domain-containing protein n=1 Tax=Tetrapyrgos nigripes TaxID=182062 RepID=A0A8H5D6N4_9AGAR|nr:hypothetical protein D9758_011175 [Tetrapyrgos nigripes]